MAASSTLTVGSKAPAFSLPAANRPGMVTLTELIAGAVAVLEFLRGTW